MANMICALAMTRELTAIILIAAATVIMLLIVLCGQKNKATAKYNAELDKEKVEDEPVEETAEPVAKEQQEVAEIAVEEVVDEVAVIEEAAESAEKPVKEVEEPTAEDIVVEEIKEEVAEEPVAEVVAEDNAESAVDAEEVAAVEEVTPVTLEEPIIDEPQQPACSDEPADEAVQEVAAVEVEKVKTKLNIPVGKKRTFAEKMIEADEENQAIYNLLKNELMSYKKVSNRLTKVIDIFKHKGAYLAKVGLTGKTVKLHLALDPNEYAVTKYHHQDLGEKKKYEFVPLALKVKSPRSQKYALELIAGVMEKAGVTKNPKYQQKDYVAEMKEAQKPADEQ
ncbi:MAG: hypothetical protein IJ999_02640 [Clostridia bacterium]|nr:hypothetical protein [Clostridia bacterium]